MSCLEVLNPRNVETGQPLGIPFLAIDLTSDEFLQGELQVPGVGNVSVKPEHKRFNSAVFIVEVVRNFRAFDATVRESADDLLNSSFSDTAWFVSDVTSWWVENREAIVSEQYGDMSGFAGRASTAVASASAAADAPAPAPDRSPPQEAIEPEYAASDENSTWWLWGVAGMVVAVVASHLLLRRRA